MKKIILGLSVVFLTTVMFSGCREKIAQEESTNSEIISQREAVDGAMDQAMPLDEGLLAENESLQPEAVSMGGVVDSSAWTKPTVEEIQQSLKNLNLYQGNVDGKLGPKTKQAIKDFQTQNSLTADGKVGPKTWAKLAPYLSSSSDAETTSN